jgi:hypothetical protein
MRNISSRNYLLAALGLVCSTPFAWLAVRAQEKEKAPLDPYTIRITAVLVDKESVPLKNSRVWLYPLDAKGEAMIIRTMPPGYVVKVWNPVTVTDDVGKFTLEMPLVTRIDDNAITVAVVGVGNPEGGLSIRSMKGIEYADPGRPNEDCLTMTAETTKLRLLRKGTGILSVILAKNKGAEVDLGKLVVE